jgi:hypothetical protein
MQIPFIGPSYTARSADIDAQRSVNLYTELKESGDAKGEPQEKYSLIGTPGYTVFCQLPTAPVRGTWVTQERMFAVAGNKLYEVFSNGTFNALGTLLTSNYYVGISDNGLQLCIVDGPNQYILTLSSNAFAVNPSGSQFNGANVVTFIDGYFVFPKPFTNKFYLSGLFDGTSLNGLDVGTKEGASDRIVAAINDHRQLYLLGEVTTEPWYDAGTASFPLAPIQGIFIETGCAGAFTVVKQDNSLIWLGQDSKGQGIVYSIQGFTPTRISTHAIEKIIKSWGDLDSAIAYSYQEEGHSFYVLNHPQAETTLVYDSATSQWHERQAYSHATGLLTRHRANFSVNFANMHILGDWQTGVLYLSSLDTYSDAGQPLVRKRRAPHISNDLQRIFYSYFQVDMETGVGIDGSGQGVAPVMTMRYSNDGGHTWSQDRTKSMGAIGVHKARAYWNKLGYGRDRVFEIEISDPVKVVLIDAKIRAAAGKADG